MLSFINQLFDKCLFTLSFIVGVQLPEFIVQYSQRLSGHLNEAKLQLSQFKQLAEIHHNGNLAQLVSSFRENQDPTVMKTADIIEQLIVRVDYLEQHLTNILSPSYWIQIKSLIVEYDVAIMQQTAKLFKLAIPLEVTSLATGALLALLIIIVKAVVTEVIKRFYLSARGFNH
ncbi:hypothetical protein tinsulaeT_38200 [Thalassotalea insulae]|uniref:DUF2937 family protein n=1 Tax=Thalassotalea insulae TaxID=2056778 RepID=A0ABQ6H0B4_9GAMM|nr:DUF2937 family protein [Thalassotalea insulae]GLX80480.1 hypothetical protein tinsulaeT_38200 [Thalassotalea insulae]